MAEGDGKAGIPIGPAEWAAGTRNADRPRPFCRTGEWGVGRMHPVTTLAEHFGASIRPSANTYASTMMIAERA